jgi:phosphoribosyl 1,2-cyclic phosphodiesterase
MLIRCWGSRGSIPVSGQEYMKYGGDTTCIEIRSEDDTIIVDAGTGIRRLGNELIRRGRLSCDLIFTHAHWDHLMGFPFFKPLYREETELRIHGYPFAVGFIEEMLSKIMSPPNFPVSYSDIKAAIQYIHGCPERFDIHHMTVVPIALSHPNQGNGYKFIEDGKVFVFLTDNELEYIHPGGCAFNDYVKFAKGADLLIHDAEYTDEELQRYRTWGHSSYRSALNLAVQAGVKRLGLFHLNQDRSDSDVDRLVLDCQKIIREEKLDLECFAVSCDMVIDL